MVDTNCAWTPVEAEAAVAAMAPYKPFWVEEPIYPPEDFEALGQAAHDHRRTHGDWRELNQSARVPPNGHHRQG
jgi:L-alanine-DL-glutamate epimerase-like enolase superfamily enzyme